MEMYDKYRVKSVLWGKDTHIKKKKANLLMACEGQNKKIVNLKPNVCEVHLRSEKIYRIQHVNCCFFHLRVRKECKIKKIKCFINFFV